jgi:hypothetical protein
MVGGSWVVVETAFPSPRKKKGKSRKWPTLETLLNRWNRKRASQWREVEEKYGLTTEKKLFGTKVPQSFQKNVKKCSKYLDGQSLTPNIKRKGSTPSTLTIKTHAKREEETRKTYLLLKRKNCCK